MTDFSVAIVGYGKMGRAIEELARQRGWSIAAVIDKAAGGRISPANLNGASVAIEFSEPAAAPGNIVALVDARCPVVVGTTGWYERLDEVSAAVRASGGAMLWAPNFSLGVQVVLRLAAAAGALVGKLRGFDAHIVETHHAAKKDKPSGTGAALEKAVRNGLGTASAVPVTSVRTGHVPGTHELIFDAPYEQIRVVHEARDRRVFAAGALEAAAWLPGRTGVFTLDDLLRERGDLS